MITRFHGVMVSTQDSESCDPSSNLGRTYQTFTSFLLGSSRLGPVETICLVVDLQL